MTKACEVLGALLAAAPTSLFPTRIVNVSQHEVEASPGPPESGM